MLSSEELFNLDAQCVMQTYGRFKVAADHGEGARVYTPEGREYIDFAAGIGVNSLGYGDEGWINAITAQAKKIGHISNLFYTEPYIQCAKRLTERTGMSKVFFANGGGEANEGMIKLARKYSFDKYGEGRATIITLINSFHGRTITTLKATGQERFHNYFFPFTEGFRYAEANSMDSLNEAYGSDVCAIMMEPVQGEGGVYPLDKDYVKAVKDFCEKNDLLLLIDEVQTGVGRTGTLFCYQQYDIVPDAVTFAKGIAGGMPLSGLMVPEKPANVLGPGMHATTFGGNPVSCAASCYVLDKIDDAFLKEVNEKGAYIRKEIESWNIPEVVTTRGAGLMIGVQLKSANPGAVAGKCVDEGLLIITAGSDALRMLPPLTITYGEIDKGLSILKKVLSEI